MRNEKPFDVFICYKEKDEHGNRTVDSSIANDIYYQLTQEGFKVFYAAITLEDKLGTAYEPYIFAALNSAKVMLVLGTKPEYFNAVWVKNEWERYLKIIKKDHNRLLIPCYRDMDAYELPEEFAHLQAQDMSKVGFITDIIRGIKKIIPKESQKSAPSETINVSVSSTAAPILKRVFLCLEDRDFQKAESLIEQVFNLDPECAEAYIAKLMIERKLTTRESLYSLDIDLKDDPMYLRALRFADDEYKVVLEEYRNESIYRKANSYLEQNTIEKYNAAKPLYDKIIDYKDARAKREGCDTGVVEINYQNACRLKREANNFNDTQRASQATEEFRKLGEYKDCHEKVDECLLLIKDIQYTSAVDFKQRAANSKEADTVSKYYNSAIAQFRTLEDYKDSKQQIEDCTELKAETLYAIALSIKESADKYNDESMYIKALSIFGQLGNYKDSIELEQECEDKRQEVHIENIYKNAVHLSEKGDILSLKNAISNLNGILNYKDSQELLEKCQNKINEINADLAKKNQIENLKTEWKQIYFNEQRLAQLKHQNASVEKSKILLRIFTIIYLVLIILILIFAANKSEFIAEGPSIINYLNVVVFENLPLLFCGILAILVSTFASRNAFVWFVNAAGVVVSPLGIIVNVVRLISPINKKEKTICKSWKKYKSEYSQTLKKKQEIENELTRMLGSEQFEQFKTVFSSSAVKEQSQILKPKKNIGSRMAYLIVISIVLGIFFVCANIIPNKNYDKAVALFNSADYEAAYLAFEKLNDFKDSPEKLQETDVIITNQQIESIKTSKLGETVLFGKFEQDGNIENGTEKIEWVVLDKNSNQAILISKYCLAQEPRFNNLQWEYSELRKWMNGQFIIESFTTEQQYRIKETEIDNMKDGNNGIKAQSTKDKVYALSVSEAEKYFSSDDSRIAAPTQYLISQIGESNAEYTTWALRTPSNDDRCVAYVGHDGMILGTNDIVINSGRSVRPVIVVNLK